MPWRLENKVIAVAGGATGIGQAAARRLAAEGATVLIADVNVAGAQETADQIREAGGSAVGIRTDISVEEEVAGLVRTAVERFGGLDGYFNNAADLSAETIGRDAEADAVSVPLDVWQRTLAVNLTGFLFGVRHAVPALLERGGGALVHTSSEEAFAGNPERVSYACSKAAILALSRHVAGRWGKDGIRSNCIAPGLVLSQTSIRKLPQELLDDKLDQTRSSRHGQPEDIAPMVCLLMSDDGAWINGQVFRINGGMSLNQ